MGFIEDAARKFVPRPVEYVPQHDLFGTKSPGAGETTRIPTRRVPPGNTLTRVPGVTYDMPTQPGRALVPVSEARTGYTPNWRPPGPGLPPGSTPPSAGAIARMGGRVMGSLALPATYAAVPDEYKQGAAGVSNPFLGMAYAAAAPVRRKGEEAISDAARWLGETFVPGVMPRAGKAQQPATQQPATQQPATQQPAKAAAPQEAIAPDQWQVLPSWGRDAAPTGPAAIPDRINVPARAWSPDFNAEQMDAVNAHIRKRGGKREFTDADAAPFATPARQQRAPTYQELVLHILATAPAKHAPAAIQALTQGYNVDEQGKRQAAINESIERRYQSANEAKIGNMILARLDKEDDADNDILLNGRKPGLMENTFERATPADIAAAKARKLQRQKLRAAAGVPGYREDSYLEEEDGRVMQGYADGGEVEYMDDEYAMPSEEAIDTTGAVASMETGDYVFPVEAVRYYGTKMLKDMVNKALTAE